MTIPPDEAKLPDHDALVTVCVTGTNGKTTTTTMIESIVAAAGETPARVTTLGSWVAGKQLASDTSTIAFVRAARRAVELGAKTLVIETTSQALSEGFAHQWPARVAVFTNLSRDHLDYHGTPERYLAAKAQLFMQLPEGGAAVLNAADPSSALLDEVTPAGARRRAYAARPIDPACANLPIALAAASVRVDRSGTRIALEPSPLADDLGGALRLRVVGQVHAENALAAAVAADALGYSARAIREGLERFEGVPGRFQIVSERPLVVVDYAHTPDALERTLKLGRSLVEDEQGKLVCVFGCGGNRDQGKRAAMGKVAGQLADIAIVTSDNPRSEDPGVIADMVWEGLVGSSARLERILERAEAIALAIRLSSPADIVVLAGKGHEQTQIVGECVLPFDDVAVARGALAVREEEED